MNLLLRLCVKQQTQQRNSDLCRLPWHLVSQSHLTWKASKPDAPSYEAKDPGVNVSPEVQGGEKNGLGGAARSDATDLLPPTNWVGGAAGDAGQRKQRAAP